MKNFKKDYYYVYLFGNDTVATLASNEFFNNLIAVFDGKISTSIGKPNNATAYLTNRKYHYIQSGNFQIVSLI